MCHDIIHSGTEFTISKTTGSLNAQSNAYDNNEFISITYAPVKLGKHEAKLVVRDELAGKRHTVVLRGICSKDQAFHKPAV